MGSFSSVGRVLLVILNLVIAILSLLLFTLGVILKYFASIVIPKLVGVLNDNLTPQQQQDFHIPEIAKVTEMPLIVDVGVFLMVLGGILFFISFTACCGACCKVRIFLIVFIISMGLLVLAQGIIGGLFLAKDSALHDAIKRTVGNKVYQEYVYGDATDAFTFAINLLDYWLECCGIRGQQDFKDVPPPTCCNRTLIDKIDDSCFNPVSPYTNFNSQGCYDKLMSEVQHYVMYGGVVLGSLLLIQVLEIMFAILIVKEDGSISPV